jgi:hypothetical protein
VEELKGENIEIVRGLQAQIMSLRAVITDADDLSRVRDLQRSNLELQQQQQQLIQEIQEIR